MYRKIGPLRGGRDNESVWEKVPEKIFTGLALIGPRSAHRVAPEGALEPALEGALGGLLFLSWPVGPEVGEPGGGAEDGTPDGEEFESGGEEELGFGHCVLPLMLVI